MRGVWSWSHAAIGMMPEAERSGEPDGSRKRKQSVENPEMWMLNNHEGLMDFAQITTI